MGKPLSLGVGAFGKPPFGDRANAVARGLLTGIGPSKPFAFTGPFNVLVWADIITGLTTTAGSDAGTVADATNLAVGDAIRSANLPPGTTIGTLAGTAVTFAFQQISLSGTISALTEEVTDVADTSRLLGASVLGDGIPSGAVVSEIIQASYPGNAVLPPVPGIIRLSVMPTLSVQDANLMFAPTGNAVLATGTDAAASFTGAAIGYTGSVQLERSFDGGETYIVCNVGNGGQLAVYDTGTPISLVMAEPESQVVYRLNCTQFTSGRINYRMSTTGAAAQSLAIAANI